MAMNDEEFGAFQKHMLLMAEECIALGSIRDKVYVATTLATLSLQLETLAAAMVQSEANDIGKKAEEVCPCPDCRRLQKTNAQTNN